MIRKMLLIALLLVWVSSYAQELPKITPPSPTAYELGKYGQVPVGMFTGTPQIHIPIYNYKAGSLSIPISLSYNSNGIKVDQMPSNVGLGWSLNAGGVITRIVRDKSDELREYIYPEEDIHNSNGLGALAYDFFRKGGSKDIDTETDLFTYNFMGYSGKFVFDNYGEIVLVPHKDIHIEKHTVGVQTGFKITTSDGITYLFLDKERSVNRSSGNHTPNVPVTSSWFISKITHPKGDVVEFIYDDYTLSYEASKSESLTVATPTYQNTCSTSGGGGTGAGYTSNPVQSLDVKTDSKRLIRIQSNSSVNGKVNISNSVLGNPGYSFISGLSITDASNTNIESFNFEYLTTAKNRVFLKQVGFKDPNKNYAFEYLDPEGLIERLSTAQDHWGYYNGKLSNQHYYPNPKTLGNSIRSEFRVHNIGADKSFDPIYAQKGLLKKVYYPTKGFNELNYEANTVWQEETIYPQHMSLLALEASSKMGETNVPANDTYKTTVTIPSDHRATLHVFVRFNDTDCSSQVKDPEATITITDDQTGNKLDILEERQSGFHIVGDHLIYNNNNSNNRYYVDFKQGHTYTIKLSPSGWCTEAELNVKYYNQPITTQFINKEVAGMRIKEVKSFENQNSLPIVTRYYYGKKESLHQSSAAPLQRPYYLSKQTVRVPCTVGCTYVDNYYATLHSNSVRQLFNAPGIGTVYYKYVTVSHGGDAFQNGGEENEFIIHDDHQGRPLLGDYIESSAWVNLGWDNSLLKRKTVFKKRSANSFIALQQTINTYKLDNRYSKKVYGYTINKKFDLLCSGDTTNNLPPENLDVMEYSTNSYWSYLDSTTEEQYDQNGENPISTTTKYFYDNPDHLQATRTETTTSENDKVIVKTTYPQDIEIKTPAINKLITQHRIAEPIQTETIVENSQGTIVSKETQLQTFKDWSNNIVLPEFVKTLKGNLNLVNPFENRIQFYEYDYKGNPLEVAKANGSHIVYIWGYQDMYPIARIENATYADVMPYVADLKAKSNTDIDHCTAATCKEQILREALQNLRDALPNAMVTTYTYDPLVGISSETDPKGQTTYYKYDDFNRLQYIIDNDDKIVEKINYNYHGQQTDALGDVIINLSGSGPFQPNQTITFTATTSGNGGADLYTWSVDGAQAQCDGSTSFTKSFSAEGTYAVSIIAYNTQTKHRVSKTISVVVAYPPINVPTVSANHTHVVKGTHVDFNASNVGGGTGNLRYEWFVNNIKQASTATTLRYNPSTAGKYNVIFKVIDNESGKTKTSPIKTINAYNPLNVPVISASSTQIIKGTNITFTVPNIGGGSGSRRYEWYVNNVKQNGATGTTYSYNFPTTGTYTIAFKTIDNIIPSHAASSLNTSVHVYNALATPGLSSNYTYFLKGATLTFTTSGIAGGSGSRRYEWYINNSKQSYTGTKLVHAFASTGTYTVKFRVLDNRIPGHYKEKSVTVYSYNPLNTPNLSASKTYIVKGTTINFTTSGIGGGSGYKGYQWFVNNVAQSAVGANFSKNFSSAGTYTIKFRVLDNRISGHYKERSFTIYSYNPMSISVSPGSAHLNNSNPSKTFRITGVSGGSGHYTRTQWKLWRMSNPSWIRNVGSGSSYTAGMSENGEYELSVKYTDSRTGQIVLKTMPIIVNKSSGGGDGGGNTGEQW
ncbi:PKD domain-containing protein [Aquimarina macrocephali]|uniref:PKD domain-containing protein n=1 Tax=Aquimarina macrocephali TaxID=666563 RepID=UPI0004BC9E87|nr:PKD domain-containing protein [Aquimarina macrocephali]